MGGQDGVNVTLGGRQFANCTVYSKAYRPRYQSLLSGQEYYVTVRATSRTVARLTANATSAPVKARPAHTPPQQLPGGLLRRGVCSICGLLTGCQQGGGLGAQVVVNAPRMRAMGRVSNTPECRIAPSQASTTNIWCAACCRSACTSLQTLSAFLLKHSLQLSEQRGRVFIE